MFLIYDIDYRKGDSAVQFRNLKPETITAELFVSFDRQQKVNNCKRKVNGKWRVISDSFIDDRDNENYLYLVSCLKNAATTRNMVCGAFIDNKLKGFVSVEGELTGSHRRYRNSFLMVHIWLRFH